MHTRNGGGPHDGGDYHVCMSWTYVWKACKIYYGTTRTSARKGSEDKGAKMCVYGAMYKRSKCTCEKEDL